MRIAINLLASKWGSGLAVNKYFLPALATNDTSNEYLVIVGAEQTKLIAAIPESFQKRVVKNVQSYPARLLWEQLVLPFYLRKWKIDALYTLGNITSLFAGCDTVVGLTNANPFSSLGLKQALPERFKGFLLRSFSILSAKKASRLIFLSRNSRDLICQKFSLPVDKTEVTYYGWTPFAADGGGQKPDLPPEYVLTVSVLWPYKNIERLMKAFDLYVERHGFSGSLVIAGSAGTQAYYESLLRLRETLPHGQRIIFTGKLALEDVAPFYKRARLFMLPSVEETLGLPLVEAMGCGIPVAAADCSLEKGMEHCFNPFREVCREAADYFNPFDEESICESMRRVLSDSKYRERLVASGLERVKSFSWELMARQTIDLFATLKQRSIRSESREDSGAAGIISS